MGAKAGQLVFCGDGDMVPREASHAPVDGPTPMLIQAALSGPFGFKKRKPLKQGGEGLRRNCRGGMNDDLHDGILNLEKKERLPLLAISTLFLQCPF